MSEQANRTPWHLWLIGAVLFAFNALGAIDYVMSVTQGQDYYRASGMTDAQVAYFGAIPFWALGAWTVSVWAGLFGGLTLLLRNKLAPLLLAVCVVGTFAYCVYTLVLSEGRAAMGAMWFMPPLVGVLTALAAAYASTMAKKGVLR